MSKSCPNTDCDNTQIYTEEELVDMIPPIECSFCHTILVEIGIDEEDLEEEEDEENDYDDEGDLFDDVTEDYD